MIKLMIADDHALLRTGLKKIICSETDMEVTCEARNAEDVLILLRKNKVSIIILDINMPGRSGLDLLYDLKTMYPGISVLILSINSEEQFARRCLEAGASGYMNKDIEPDEFISAIRKIAQGHKYFSDRFMEILLEEVENRRTGKMPHEALSAREFEVMRLIANGAKYREIAEAMSISEKTISTYRNRILTKLNLKNTDQIKEYARRNELV
ncbi:MAG: response regulator transcription factor [Ignavibacteria bacterium]|jgi:DNA-binding NarL/FixJ family response regulator|nr:response regulator transcription factor [Ignavibacteria bacterium]MCU7504760.1 response regulator transcription factor [Ignavibacteria bacterium]MCU7516362.1 response regulator transcription factor [Ignavibacteria bacterium]